MLFSIMGVLIHDVTKSEVIYDTRDGRYARYAEPQSSEDETLRTWC